MPLLDWGAPNNASIVSPRLWIYWAVTVPLTATVLLLWSIWYLGSGRARTQSHSANGQISTTGSRRPQEFEMHVFTIPGLDLMRRKFTRLRENHTVEEMTDLA